MHFATRHNASGVTKLANKNSHRKKKKMKEKVHNFCSGCQGKYFSLFRFVVVAGRFAFIVFCLWRWRQRDTLCICCRNTYIFATDFCTSLSPSSSTASPVVVVICSRVDDGIGGAVQHQQSIPNEQQQQRMIHLYLCKTLARYTTQKWKTGKAFLLILLCALKWHRMAQLPGWNWIENCISETDECVCVILSVVGWIGSCARRPITLAFFGFGKIQLCTSRDAFFYRCCCCIGRVNEIASRKRKKRNRRTKFDTTKCKNFSTQTKTRAFSFFARLFNVSFTSFHPSTKQIQVKCNWPIRVQKEKKMQTCARRENNAIKEREKSMRFICRFFVLNQETLLRLGRCCPLANVCVNWAKWICGHRATTLSLVCVCVYVCAVAMRQTFDNSRKELSLSRRKCDKKK